MFGMGTLTPTAPSHRFSHQGNSIAGASPRPRPRHGEPWLQPLACPVDWDAANIRFSGNRDPGASYAGVPFANFSQRV